MPYQVTAPEVSILRDLSVFKDNEGKVTGYDRDSLIYTQGEVIPDSDVAQVVKDAYNAGDPHIRGIIEYVSGDVDPAPEPEHDVNQDLNLSAPDEPVTEKEFETVQYQEDGPQEFSPQEKADAVDTSSDDISQLSREELNSKAAELGIDEPEKIKGGKAKVIEAIESAQSNKSE